MVSHQAVTPTPPRTLRWVIFWRNLLQISEGDFRVSQASRVEVKISKFLLEYAGPVPNPEFFTNVRFWCYALIRSLIYIYIYIEINRPYPVSQPTSHQPAQPTSHPAHQPPSIPATGGGECFFGIFLKKIGSNRPSVTIWRAILPRKIVKKIQKRPFRSRVTWIPDRKKRSVFTVFLVVLKTVQFTLKNRQIGQKCQFY